MQKLRMRTVWISSGIISGFVILIFVFRSYQIPEEVQLLSQEHVATVRLPVVSAMQFRWSLIVEGKGTYNLSRPSNKYWSQYGQDKLLDEMFKQKRNGFFVEIGGFDGETFSNTLFFERERGWSGLLVEANPYTYDFMVKKDRKCFMLNACISNTLPNMTFVIGGAITSAKETMTDKHRKRIDKEALIYEKDQYWLHAKEKVVVKCYSLVTILKSLGQTHIDYFSLDVEGAEMFILESIDWKQLDIDTFTIETDQHRDQILAFMKSHNYKWVRKVIGDDLFVKIK